MLFNILLLIFYFVAPALVLLVCRKINVCRKIGPVLTLYLLGVAVANVTEVHKHLLTKKRYGDMTANNVNHPNDWLIRMQGQIIAQALWPNLQ